MAALLGNRGSIRVRSRSRHTYRALRVGARARHSAGHWRSSERPKGWYGCLCSSIPRYIRPPHWSTRIQVRPFRFCRFPAGMGSAAAGRNTRQPPADVGQVRNSVAQADDMARYSKPELSPDRRHGLLRRPQKPRTPRTAASSGMVSSRPARVSDDCLSKSGEALPNIRNRACQK